MASLEAARLFSVPGMVFVITGGGSGIGEMMAQALDINGASKVFILGRRKESLAKVASRAACNPVSSNFLLKILMLVSEEPQYHSIGCDVTSKESLAAAADVIEKETPFVNAVIANAGAIGPITGFYPRPENTTVADIQKQLWDTSLEDSNSTMDVNVLGSFHTFLAFLNLLDAGNKHADSPGSKGWMQSQFITTSSYTGMCRSEDIGYEYHASKAALIHLTKMLATGFAKYGIRANSIAPGLFMTEMTEFIGNHLKDENLSMPGKLPREVNPTTRGGNEEDMAGAILFLTSRAGGFINGNVLVSDGGTLSLRPGTY